MACLFAVSICKQLVELVGVKLLCCAELGCRFAVIGAPADFGLAVNHLLERPVTRLGTLDYMAPEVGVCLRGLGVGGDRDEGAEGTGGGEGGVGWPLTSGGRGSHTRWNTRLHGRKGRWRSPPPNSR